MVVSRANRKNSGSKFKVLSVLAFRAMMKLSNMVYMLANDLTWVPNR